MAIDNIKQRLTAAGVAAAFPLIVAYEGTKQTAYLDPVSIPTICRGHTGGVKLGQTATMAQCDDLTVQDLLKATAAIDSCVHVPLNDNQRAAFASFTFNVGGAKFCKSSAARKLNAGDPVGACNELPKWIYAGDKVLPGLVKRRAAERDLCLKVPT